MDQAVDTKSKLVVCETRNGTEIRGNILRLCQFEVTFEIYSLPAVIQVSEVFSQFQIMLAERVVYCGRATVKSLVNTGLTVACEVLLDRGWSDVNFLRISRPGEVKGEYDTFVTGWEKAYRIAPEYKIAVADIQSFLMELRSWLEQVELAVRSTPSGDRLQLEQDLLEELGKPVVSTLDGLFDRFESAAATVPERDQPSHRNYMKQLLHPLILCAPFVYRTYFKPFGYAGDYEMVDMIARNPFEGGSMFAKLVNLWFLQQAPAQAHRNRLAFIERKLTEETGRVACLHRPIRVLNLGCGPAIELQHFLKSCEISSQAHITLMDFNDEAVRHVESVLEGLKRTWHRGTRFEYQKKAVQQILRESGKNLERAAEQRFDFIYCAGLFDYLSDQICQRLISVFYQWLAPEGLMLLTNVDHSNPRQHTMEAVLEWNLIYRNTQETEKLLPSTIPRETIRIHSEISGVNILLEIKKPRNG